MCGIAGIINTGSVESLSQMSGAISHRGPDGSGIEWFPHVNSGLAHRRLAILDLTPSGRQPMCSENRRYWIVHNGEVYNFKQLRETLSSRGYRFVSHTDTEVILNSFQEWGIDCLEHFNGMFAFAVFDTLSGTVFLARDRIGVRPLYYAFARDGLVFASEIKAILASGLVPKEPDYEALHTPARYQVCPRTGFKDINKLRPGHFLQFCNGETKIHPYWRIVPTATNGQSIEEATVRLNELLMDSIHLQLNSDVPVGVLLSGGVDSSLVSAGARRAAGGDMHSFTVSFRSEDQSMERMGNDAPYALRVASLLGLSHHDETISPDIADLLPKLIWHLDEPLSDPAAINVFLLCKLARSKGVHVLLSGMGGDEIFGGYRKHFACLKADLYQSIVPRLLRDAAERLLELLPVSTNHEGLLWARWIKRFASIGSLPRFERYLSSDLSLTPKQYESIFTAHPTFSSSLFFRSQQEVFANGDRDYLSQMCLNDTLFFLPEHNLLYSDKAAMAQGVEIRPPLTDHRIVEFMFSQPSEFLIRNGTQKYLLKKVARQYLPEDLVNRPKVPFGVPLRAWIRGPLSEMVSDLLSIESLRKRGVYHPEYVDSLVVRNKKGLEDNSLVIWTLLSNETWFRVFFG